MLQETQLLTKSWIKLGPMFGTSNHYKTEWNEQLFNCFLETYSCRDTYFSLLNLCQREDLLYKVNKQTIVCAAS